MPHTLADTHDWEPRGREHWTVGDLERLGAATTAGLLMAYGITRRSLPGVLLAAAAVPLAYRGLSGRWPGYMSLAAGDEEGNGDRAITARALSGDRGIHVRESVRIEKPLP